MNEEQCEYYADFLLAKAKGECVEVKDINGLWSVWIGDTFNSMGNHTVLRIKPDPEVIWVNKSTKGVVSTFKAEDVAKEVAARSVAIKFKYIAKRFVEDV